MTIEQFDITWDENYHIHALYYDKDGVLTSGLIQTYPNLASSDLHLWIEGHDERVKLEDVLSLNNSRIAREDYLKWVYKTYQQL